MLFREPPPWCVGEDSDGRPIITVTNTIHPAYTIICVPEQPGSLQQYLEGNGIEFLPAHDLLQNMLCGNPQDRFSTTDILNHEWLRED